MTFAMPCYDFAMFRKAMADNGEEQDMVAPAIFLQQC